MKKIYLALLFVCTLLVSCDMDKAPYGALDDNTAIQSVNDAFRFRNGLYTGLRGLSTGAYVSYPELQMDMFVGLISNGNRGGSISNGVILSSDDDFESIWAGVYTRINSASYLIEKIDGLRNSGNFAGDDLVKLNLYEGEAKFMRAFYYFWLADHFCETYTAENADAPAMGLPLVTVYNPTGDTSKYPGRSTQNETYAQIDKDLTDALAALKAYEASDIADAKANLAPNAFYVSSNAAVALQARIALCKGDNQTAFDKATAVISSGAYTLATADEYADMWAVDASPEVILRSFMSSTELSSSTGSAWLVDNGGKDKCDYIPTVETLLAYDDGDVRFDAFFSVWKVVVEGNTYPLYAFTKYPGNASLMTTATPNYMNMPKIFRLSEQYLIAAEAASNIAGKEADANKYLNALRAARIEGYEAGNYAGVALKNQIRAERSKELMGEGFRMSDLRRWNLGFERYGDYSLVNPEVNGVIVKAGQTLSYQAGDHRYVWPIPTAEIESNPQMVGQQNAGY